jgi:transposase
MSIAIIQSSSTINMRRLPSSLPIIALSCSQKQAIGRSRGGRNTKFHALADARGRLLAILLTGGEAHDCPVAERLIAIGKASKRLIGDKAYDSAELRLWLKDRGTKPVIPNRSNRKQPFSSTGASTKNDGASRTPSVD